MKHSRKAGDFAVLMYIGGPWMGDKREYWVTFDGHAHCQPLSGSRIGPLGHRCEDEFRTG